MKAKNILVLTILICTGNFIGFSPSCCSQESEIKSDKRLVEAQCTYKLTAPDGWCWDEDSYSEYFPRPVFYRIDKRPPKNELQIYVVLRRYKINDSTELNTYLQKIGKLAKIEDSSLLVEKANPIVINKKLKAQVRYYFSLNDSTFKAIAYIGYNELILEFTLFSSTKEMFYKSLPGFEQLVKSFTPATVLFHQVD